MHNSGSVVRRVRRIKSRVAAMAESIERTLYE
jgi:hypothetical protein